MPDDPLHKAAGLLQEAAPGHWGAIQGIAWSPDGALLASASTDGTVRIWNAKQGTTERILVGFAEPPASLDWSVDGRLAVVDESGTVRVWDDLGQDPSQVEEHKEHAWRPQIAWSPDGRLAVCNHGVRVYDPALLNPRDVFKGKRVAGVAWSPGGQLAGFQRRHPHSVFVWDGEDTRDLGGVQYNNEGIGWFDEGRLALTGDDGDVKLLHVSSGEVIARSRAGGRDRMRCIAAGSERLAVDAPGGVSVIHNEHLESTQRFEDPRDEPARCVAFSPDGRLAAGNDAGSITIWDVRGRVLSELEGRVAPPSSVAVSKDRRWAVHIATNRVGLWNLEGIHQGVVHVDDSWSTEIGLDATGIIKSYSIETGSSGAQIHRVICFGEDGSREVLHEGHGWEHLDVFTDGTVLATSRYGHITTGVPDGTVHEWFSQDPTKNEQIWAARWTPDGHVLAGGSSCSFGLWDASGTLLTRFEGHTHDVMALAALADGEFVSAGDTTFRWWDAEGNELRKKELGFFPHLADWSKGGHAFVYDDRGSRLVMLAPDGNELWSVKVLNDVSDIRYVGSGRFITSDEAGIARFWSINHQMEGWVLPAWGTDLLPTSAAPLGVMGEPLAESEGTGIGRPPDPGLVPHRPISSVEEDRLDHDDFAAALHLVITHEGSERPITVAVNAPWGSGKTGIAHLLEQKLGSDYACTRFNAWAHDHKGALLPAFLRTVAQAADRERRLSRRLKEPLPRHLCDGNRLADHVLERAALPTLMTVVFGLLAWVAFLCGQSWNDFRVVDPAVFWGYAVAFSFSLALLYATLWVAAVPFYGWPATRFAEDFIAGNRILEPVKSRCYQNVWSLLSFLSLWAAFLLIVANPKIIRIGGIFAISGAELVFLGGLLVIPMRTALATVWARLLAYVRDPQAEERAAHVPQVRDDLCRLVQQAHERNGKTIVIFVDDLERCRQPHAVEILEAIDQLLSEVDLIVVLMADMELVAKQVALKYKGLALPLLGRDVSAPSIDDAPPLAFGTDYVRKMVQIQFDVPPLLQGRFERFARGALESRKIMIAPPVKAGAPNASPTDVAGGTAPAAVELEPSFKEAVQFTEQQVQDLVHQAEQLLAPYPEPYNWGGLREALEKLRALRSRPLTHQQQAAQALQEKVEEWKRDHPESQPLLPEEAKEIAKNPEILAIAIRAAQPLGLDTPRAVHRFLNAVMMHLYLVSRRGRLQPSGGEGLSPECIALWCAFQERWPLLVQAMLRDSDLRGRLADPTRPGWNDYYQKALGSQRHQQSVRRFLVRDDAQAMINLMDQLASFGEMENVDEF